MGAAGEHIQPHTPGSHKHGLQRKTEEADVQRGAEMKGGVWTLSLLLHPRPGGPGKLSASFQ